MKNNNVDIKSLIIGFLMATCMMMALGANSKPISNNMHLSGSLSITHKGNILDPIYIRD